MGAAAVDVHAGQSAAWRGVDAKIVEPAFIRLLGFKQGEGETIPRCWETLRGGPVLIEFEVRCTGEKFLCLLLRDQSKAALKLSQVSRRLLVPSVRRTGDLSRVQ